MQWLTGHSGRGRKPVLRDTIEEVGTANVNGEQNSIAGTCSADWLARNLDMTFCRVGKILRKVIHFYS